MNRIEYIFLNRLIIIAGVFMMCLVILFGGAKCVHVSYVGVECSSCGVTRDILAFLTLDFNSPINPNSFNVFLFGVFQLMYRLIISGLKNKENIELGELNEYTLVSIKKVIIADAMITFFMFIAVFLPFWI